MILQRKWVAWSCIAVCACGGVDPAEMQNEEGPDSNPSGIAPEPSPDVDAGAGDAGATPDPELEPYLPLAEGTRWTYDVTDDGVVTRKVTTVGAEELVGGTGPNADVLAFKVTTEKNDGNDETISWQARSGALVVRYREQAFGPSGLDLDEHWAPYKLRLDESLERIAEGAMWQEVYEETKLVINQAPVTSERVDTWTVLGTNEPVTVPAGTFDCLHVRKIGLSSNKEYWFARGVGKVKEVGGQTEELVSVEVP